MGFPLLSSNYSTFFLNILLMLVFLFCMLVSTLCILCVCIVLCIISPFVHSCPFLTFMQVYQPLPPGGNPIAVNKYHISYQKLQQFNI